MYYKVRVDTGELLEGPIPLPDRIAGLSINNIKNLSSVGPSCPEDLLGIGYWPIEYCIPENFDAARYKVSSEPEISVMMAQQTVRFNYNLIPLSQEELNQLALDKAHETLNALDTVLPRAVEDLISAQNIGVTILPPIMQSRLAAKVAARELIRSIKG